MFILTRSTNKPGLTDPVGIGDKAQHASSFIDRVRPCDRSKVYALEGGQRTAVVFCPMDGDVGFQVEVFKCHGGKVHDEAFNEAMESARNGDIPSPEGLTKRQSENLAVAICVAQIRKGGAL